MANMTKWRASDIRDEYQKSQINKTAESLGIPMHAFFRRRIARALSLVEDGKVVAFNQDNPYSEGLYRVQSQFEANRSYVVGLDSGNPFCTCPDGERTIYCKHRIASLIVDRVAQL